MSARLTEGNAGPSSLIPQEYKELIACLKCACLLAGFAGYNWSTANSNMRVASAKQRHGCFLSPSHSARRKQNMASLDRGIILPHKHRTPSAGQYLSFWLFIPLLQRPPAMLHPGRLCHAWFADIDRLRRVNMCSEQRRAASCKQSDAAP